MPSLFTPLRGTAIRGRLICLRAKKCPGIGELRDQAVGEIEIGCPEGVRQQQLANNLVAMVRYQPRLVRIGDELHPRRRGRRVGVYLAIFFEHRPFSRGQLEGRLVDRLFVGDGRGLLVTHWVSLLAGRQRGRAILATQDSKETVQYTDDGTVHCAGVVFCFFVNCPG